MGSGKQFIMPVIVLLIVAGAFAAGYKFYFQEQAEKLKKDNETLATVKNTVKTLASTFEKTDPEKVVKVWRNGIQPWAEARDRRTSFFNLGDLSKVDPMPEGKIPKFYYKERYEKLLGQLREEAARARCYIPDTSFGAPSFDSIASTSVSKEDVQKWLRQLTFGCNITRFFMENKASAIQEIRIWKPREDYKLLWLRTVGVRMTMTVENLVTFLDKLERSDRYFSVEAIRIRNNSLRTSWDPPLEVEMVLTQCFYDKDKATQPQAVEAPAEAAPGGANDAFLQEMRTAQP